MISLFYLLVLACISDSTELKKFLNELKDDEVILVTTSDDAAYK